MIVPRPAKMARAKSQLYLWRGRGRERWWCCGHEAESDSGFVARPKDAADDVGPRFYLTWASLKQYRRLVQQAEARES